MKSECYFGLSLSVDGGPGGELGNFNKMLILILYGFKSV